MRATEREKRILSDQFVKLMIEIVELKAQRDELAERLAAPDASGKKIAAAARKAAKAITKDISGRARWKWELEKTEPAVLNGEILPAWRKIITQAIRDVVGGQ